MGLGGLILSTDDGGKRWAPLPSPTEEGLYDIALAEPNSIIVGDAGTLLRSTDGGTTWSTHGGNPEIFGWLRGIASPDGQRFVVVGAHGLVLLSDDGGRSWKRVP